MIVDFLKQASIRIDTNNELALQNDVEMILKEVGVEYIREHNFTQKDRIDFLVGDTGIECKIAGSSLDVFRQLKRYAKHCKELVLLTSKNFTMPEHIDGIPLHVVLVSCFTPMQAQSIPKESDVTATVAVTNEKGVNKILIITSNAIVRSKIRKWFNFPSNYTKNTFTIPFYTDSCSDVLWFSDRYDFEFLGDSFDRISDKAAQQEICVSNMNHILFGARELKQVPIKAPYEMRGYQKRFVEALALSQKMLLADDTGLGKSLSGIGAISQYGELPALIVCQTHLQIQWEKEVQKFTDYTTHIIKTTKPYELPKADVYIITYSKLQGWVDDIEPRAVIFDEVQQFRRGLSTYKGAAGAKIAKNANMAIGLTATPIYNYGDEIYNVLTIINSTAFDGIEYSDFINTWCSYDGMRARINDGKALGQYIRERGWMIRRSRKDVSMELDPVNTIIKEVECDIKEFKKYIKQLKELSVGYLQVKEFTEKGMIARELNNVARMATGVGKASSVADEVRNIAESGKVLLVGWHRDVYTIWMDKLKDLNPVMYTGSETPIQKNKAIQKFIEDDTCKVFIMSLRSGEGLNGLQHVCSNVVFGEFDWSPQVHHQIVSRLSRDGQENGVNAIYCSMNAGVDPVMVDVLGLKMAQSESIINPDMNVVETNDFEKLKELAERLKDL